MKRRAVAAGMALAAIVAAAGAGSPVAAGAQETPARGAWLAAQGAAAPEPAAEVPLPPHLVGGLPRPLPGGAGVGLPTLQDLMQISPTYAAPPPPRHKKRQRSGQGH